MLTTRFVFAPTLAHWDFRLRYSPSHPPQPYVALNNGYGRCDLPLGYAMLTTRFAPAAYVDPFDRICHGLRDRDNPRNYRLERSIP